MKKAIRKIILSLVIASVSLICGIGFCSAETVASGDCGNNVIYSLDDSGTLTIAGTGSMSDFDPESLPYFKSAFSIRNVIIG